LQVEIDDLIEVYQGDHSQENAIAIINVFEPLIDKFIGIIKYQKIILSDQNTVKFLSLFINDKETRYRLLKKRMPEENKEEVIKISRMIKQCFSCVDADDIRNDMISIILEMANKYKNKGKSFLGYLNSTIHYEIYRSIIKYMGDPLSYATVYDENTDDERAIDAEYFTTSDWVGGLTAEPPFDKLKSVDRVILAKKYIDKKTVKQMSEEMGYSMSYVNQRIRQIKDLLIENNLIDKN
jgi:hypothetical protein